MRRTAPICLILTLLLAAAGCGRRAASPPVNVGYDALFEPWSHPGDRPLAGRLILIDPGHGGVFRGVVGRDGFSEAEANLGVALYLRGLLEEAGARVVLTRSSDRDFLTPADSSLAADLAHRTALCDSLRPDVFLSLHHNSNAALDRDLNETQTYYPVGREGADLDLARSIHTHLARNLGIRPAKILPGNFAVLRGAPADVPAVLGEPSMLSNPAVEARLATAPKLELEARAYFLGLLDYFAGGTPRWRAPYAGAATWVFEPGPEGPPLDPASLTLLVDGRPEPLDLAADGLTATWRPGLRWQAHRVPVALTARNLSGRATPTLLDTVQVTGAPQLVLRRYADGWYSWRLLDPAGAPLPLEAESWLCGPDGDCRYQLGAAGESVGAVRLGETRPVSWQLGDGSGYAEFRLPPPLLAQDMTTTEGIRWVRLTGGPGPWQDRLRRGGIPGGLTPPPADEPFVATRPGAPLWLERPGCAPLIRDGGAMPDSLSWRILLPHLAGRTIVIDPAGGGADAQGTAPLGTPGRELNLQVARRLAELLRGAGMTVHLTRTAPGWVPDEEKVLLANRTGASLFLHLRRGEGPAPVLEHHHGSGNGARWAELTAGALADAGLAAPTVGPSYAYLLRHTAPPALSCALPMPATEDAERAARTPSVQQAQAWALLRAVDAYFRGGDLPAGWDLASFMAEHRANFPHPDDLDLIRVDGLGSWLPPTADGPRALLPPADAPRILEVRSGDRWWLFEAAADGPRRLLSGAGDRALDPTATEAPRPLETDATGATDQP
ncbi:MAG TPA: N-acetylmuramoyl-L-alanine amidase [Candidatus Krumholzibacteria bacterium]|nr:N-acetylmuramoyl-L-alanine amidase [Candidatus Krumholzibacteria bacterium]